MNVLIFSDTHLTDRFEPAKFAYLKRIILQADKVVINGDFWDGYYVSFDQFLNSKWRELFPILKDKHAIYIVGNHDRMSMINDKALVFCDEYQEFKKISMGNFKFHIEHGNRFSPGIVERYPWILNDLTRLANRIKKVVMFKLFKENTTKLSGKAQSTNKKIIKWTQNNLADGEIFIAGHSHLPVDELKKRFFNDGQIDQGVASYLTIIDEAKQVRIELTEEYY